MYSDERYVNGMYNIAWIAGFMRDLQTEGNQLRAFRIQQTNNLNHALPIRLTTPRPRAKYFDTVPISVQAHLFGRRLDNGERVIEARAFDIDAPDLMHLPGLDAWTKSLPPGAPTDDFKPNDGAVASGQGPMNSVELAGFVLGAAMARDEQGRAQNDCLIVLLQQHEDETQALPVRLYGRFAAKYRDLVEPGQPLKVSGQLRVRVKPVGPPPSRCRRQCHRAGRRREVPVHPLFALQGDDPGRRADTQHAVVGAGTSAAAARPARHQGAPPQGPRRRPDLRDHRDFAQRSQRRHRAVLECGERLRASRRQS